MRKLLLLSLLVLFGCSKDNLESADSGNKIIGNYQLVQKTSVEQAEFSVWGASSPTGIKGRSNVTGKVFFSSNSTGYFDIIVEGSKNIRVNFDWSYQGRNWYVIDENSEQWVINNSDRCVSDTIYCSSGKSNTSSLYLMEKRRGIGSRNFLHYKLVF
tara:strand:- start:4527 stop:4997 length:471 start_codon:yes stop_codon:yes gene_type:complete